ncbi:ALI_HP2_G0026130.mRNA.1.CDS.1 [Saccharomyces cerevisiae]|nr:ALI_HP2_G0026130.mRNA.1.CDS.1 [Saccharomyces cerevisiae]CAI6557425.1 ALI_HP2_G0026130.mRNA.1.CDS.1 [Saccharomyces cerevisiae]
MDRKRSFENCRFRHGREKMQKFLTFVEDEPDFRADQSLQSIFIPKKINLMVYNVVSSAYFEIQ